MDGPGRVAGGAGMIDRGIVGEDCRLRGVGFRWRGGDLEAATRLCALPSDEALCRPGSSAGEYLAYC